MNYTKNCKYSYRLLKKITFLDDKNQLDFGQINKAIWWAKKYHNGQFRRSGEPFYTHPLEVAYMVSDYNLKTEVIITSILHDIIEDTEVTAGMILDTFGWRIAEMVDRLTRDRPDGTKLSVEVILNNAYDKNDKEVLLIKVIDRLHNMQTLGSMSVSKVSKITTETLISFITSSMYVGILEVEQLLLDSCIYYNHEQNKESYRAKPVFSFNNNSSILSLVS